MTHPVHRGTATEPPGQARGLDRVAAAPGRPAHIRSFIVTVSLGDIAAMPDATVPAPRSASGPGTNPGAGQTMHPARPVRQKNEPSPTRAPGNR